MAKYRKIDVRIWNDIKFKALSDDGKLLFMLVMTHPGMTMVGAMRSHAASLSVELGWSFERLSKGLGELLSNGMLKYDETSFLIWLPNFLRYNKPENPNVVLAWSGVFELLPDCELKALVLLACESFIQTMGEGFRKAFERVTSGMAKTENREQRAGNRDKKGGAQDAPSPPVEILKPEKPKPAAEGSVEPTAAECSQAMFEYLAIVAPAKTKKLAADAIGMQAVSMAMTPYRAMLVIRRKAELAIAAGETVNAFWFEDSKWKADRTEVGLNKLPDCAACGNRRMVLKDVGGTRMALQCECMGKPAEAAENAPEGVDPELGARIWTGMSKALKGELSAQSYETWIKPIRPLGTLNGELYLQIPTKDFSHVGDRYEIARFLPEGIGEIHLLSREGVAA